MTRDTVIGLWSTYGIIGFVVLIVGLIIYYDNKASRYQTANKRKWKKIGARMVVTFPIWPLAFPLVVVLIIKKMSPGVVQIFKDAT